MADDVRGAAQRLIRDGRMYMDSKEPGLRQTLREDIATVARYALAATARPAPTAADARDAAVAVLAALKDRHQERAAGALWNGKHGACSACMLPYPCKIMQAIIEAETEVTR